MPLKIAAQPLAVNFEKQLCLFQRFQKEKRVSIPATSRTPADEHLNKRRIALSKLADEAEDAARRLR